MKTLADLKRKFTEYKGRKIPVYIHAKTESATWPRHQERIVKQIRSQDVILETCNTAATNGRDTYLPWGKREDWELKTCEATLLDLAKAPIITYLFIPGEEA